MDKQPSDQKQDEVTQDVGDESPSATPHAGTGPIGGSSPVPPGASGGDSCPPPPPAGSPKSGGQGGESMRPLSAQGKQPALTGGSSTTAAGSPPPPSESLEGTQAEGEGLKKKRKKAAFDGPELPKPCSICSRPFSSWKALFGHMRSHKGRQWRGVFPPPISPPKEQVHDEQAEDLSSTLLNIGQRILAQTKGSNTEGDGSAVAEGSASSSAAEVRRKKIHMELDLNKEAPEDSDEEGGGDNDGA